MTLILLLKLFNGKSVPNDQYANILIFLRTFKLCINEI